MASVVVTAALISKAAAKSDFVEWGPSANVEEQFDLVLSREIPLQQLVQEDSGIPALSDDRPV